MSENDLNMPYDIQTKQTTKKFADRRRRSTNIPWVGRHANPPKRMTPLVARDVHLALEYPILSQLLVVVVVVVVDVVDVDDNMYHLFCFDYSSVDFE